MSDYISIDIEATGLSHKKDRILGIGVYKPNKYKFFHKDGLPSNLLDYTQIYHNGIYDTGWGIEGLRYDHDTQIMSSLLPLPDHDLESLSVQLLMVEPWKKSINRKDMANVPIEELKTYNRLDCKNTYDLYPILVSRLKKVGQWEYYNKYSMPLARELVLIEQGGIRLNLKYLKELEVEYEEKATNARRGIEEEYKDGIKKIEEGLLCKVQDKVKTEVAKQARAKDPAKYGALFNIDSPIQLLELLHYYSQYPKNWKEKDSTDTESLTKLDTGLSKGILEYRHNVKIKQYFKQWDDLKIGDMLYPSYHMHTAITGRLSSSDPNIQQVPVRDDSRIRDIFIPADGKVFVIVDYSQIEFRLAAYFSKDKALIQAFKEGGDFHGKMAINIFGLKCSSEDVKELHPDLREIAKTAVYLTIYGGSASGFVRMLKAKGIQKSEEECKEIQKKLFRTCPSLRQYGFKLGFECQRLKYVKTLFGRKVWVPVGEERHKSLNYQVQGSASELTAFSIIDMGPKVRELGGRIVALIHDEIIIECDKDKVDKVKELINYYMVDRIKLSVPMDVGIGVGNSWGAK